MCVCTNPTKFTTTMTINPSYFLNPTQISYCGFSVYLLVELTVSSFARKICYLLSSLTILRTIGNVAIVLPSIIYMDNFSILTRYY